MTRREEEEKKKEEGVDRYTGTWSYGKRHGWGVYSEGGREVTTRGIGWTTSERTPRDASRGFSRGKVLVSMVVVVAGWR